MPSGIALVIWIVGMGAGVCFVAFSVIRASFLKYFFLNLYVVLSLSLTCFANPSYGFTASSRLSTVTPTITPTVC